MEDVVRAVLPVIMEGKCSKANTLEVPVVRACVACADDNNKVVGLSDF